MQCATVADSGSGEDATASEAWKVAFGISLGLTASIGINVGNNLQALGLQQQETSGSERKTRTFKIGTSLFAGDAAETSNSRLRQRTAALRS